MGIFKRTMPGRHSEHNLHISFFFTRSLKLFCRYTCAVNCLLQGMQVKLEPRYQGILGSVTPTLRRSAATGDLSATAAAATNFTGELSLLGINWEREYSKMWDHFSFSYFVFKF